jgi:tripartite-type tricarboxylate transporter receptor subunit TctC
VVDDPGTADDLYAKTLQANLKGVSPVDIKVVCEPSAVGGTWYTVQDIPRRAGGRDGYYVVIAPAFGIATDLLCEPGTKKIQASLDQISMIISTEITPYVFLQRKNTPWGRTMADMVKYAKANPGKVKYISHEVGSGMDIAAMYVIHATGIDVKKIPQGSQQECASTVGAGQGDFTCTGLNVGFANYQAGTVDVSFVMGDTVPELFKKSNPNLQCAKDMGLSTFIGVTKWSYATSSQVPKAHVDWLFKLFKAGSTTDAYKEQRAKILPGIIFQIADPAAMDAELVKVNEVSDPILRAIGLHVDQRK